MGKKYIIEIPEDKIPDFVGSTHFLMPYMMAGHIGHHDTGLPIKPYTEPDMEQVRKEAYDKGYMAAYVKSHMETRGSYQQGLNDAWEAARKIYLPVEYGGLPADVLRQMFNNKSASGIFKKVSASEAIEKIRQYEQEQEESEESEKEQSVTAEEVMRQYLDTFCKHNFCKECPLHTPDFTCGRGYHFLTNDRISNEEVRRAYAEVLEKMREGQEQ